MSGRWCVKVRRYGGGESVLGIYDDRAEAERDAHVVNTHYQTDTYYVEEWEPSKIVWPEMEDF